VADVNGVRTTTENDRELRAQLELLRYIVNSKSHLATATYSLSSVACNSLANERSIKANLMSTGAEENRCHVLS
jgi:hypothetical protein